MMIRCYSGSNMRQSMSYKGTIKKLEEEWVLNEEQAGAIKEKVRRNR